MTAAATAAATTATTTAAFIGLSLALLAVNLTATTTSSLGLLIGPPALRQEEPVVRLVPGPVVGHDRNRAQIGDVSVIRPEAIQVAKVIAIDRHHHIFAHHI
jgi:hypothetical protein